MRHTIETISNAVKRMTTEQLGLDDSMYNISSSFAEMGADSLDMVELIMFAEEVFEIFIDDVQGEKLITPEKAINYLCSRQGLAEVHLEDEPKRKITIKRAKPKEITMDESRLKDITMKQARLTVIREIEVEYPENLSDNNLCSAINMAMTKAANGFVNPIDMKVNMLGISVVIKEKKEWVRQ